MGLIKKIKNSYVFTQFEVGKYTKRRNGSNTARDQSTEAHGTVRASPGNEFISAFDQAADEVRREQLSGSAETIGAAPSIQRFKSSVELSATQRAQAGPLAYAESRGSTAVSTPQASPFSDTADNFDGQPLPRARPKGARAARSTMDMQSVYFAPGRNVSMTNQQKQRLSVYATDVPRFDKNSASSMDYYVFTPTRREVAQMPLDAKRRTRGLVAPDEAPSPSLHQEPEGLPTNPFVERRKKAQQMARSPTVERWESHGPSSPFADQSSGGGSADEPRRYLNTPVYASGSTKGLDLLA
ncbi:hypothetical protein GGH94_005708 [Coemansia aciculifera]|uniref:Uncharacterized protein n=1 Tax=Coemansia aciculifera TaxID=417176 RepID=A0A9W8IFL1_9FUNG|nr:hypothetical protein GGH94_005708 [Coemansia aciculifera]KAJ2870710.1 hypothetical protein GGH93_005361 [Coemansia aciculifera]